MTNTDVVLDVLRHSDQGDFTRFRELLTPDCEWSNPMIRAEGPDQIAANVASFASTFPRRHHQVTCSLESGDTVAIEGSWVATHESGHEVDVPFAALMRLQDSKIASVRIYLDTGAFAAQLAAAGATAGAGSR